ncbi:hypothetical protein C8J57DRAFT_1705802 [Mycena rebaudengoi]|nr:hypothetical protein C8J57DRAFT_1705802 [Mycena rebaudengoi]
MPGGDIRSSEMQTQRPPMYVPTPRGSTPGILTIQVSSTQYYAHPPQKLSQVPPPADAEVSKACLRLRKGVAFSAVLEEVHPADEWDRTPTEPARRLSY